MLKLTLAALVLVIIGAIYFLFSAPEVSNNQSDDNSTSNIPTQTLEQRADLENRPILIIGQANAPVTIVEYGDFKCPACNQFHHGAGKEIRQNHIDTGQVKIEFRNYPFLGPDSGRAARASYCANDQNAFATYHDKVYEYIWDTYYTKGDLNAEFRDVLTFDILEELMDDTIEDKSTFAECIRSEDYNKFIDADLLLGAEDGITGTPGFVIGDQSISGPSNYNTFKTLIDIELNR